MRWWARISVAVLDGLYPRRCALCGLLGELVICRDCHGVFERLEPVWHRLVRDARSLEVAHVWRYGGRSAQAVQRLKYERVTGLGEPMARDIAEALAALALPADFVFVPVPIHWTREFERGFNQSVLLCERLEEDRVRLDLLRRVRRTAAQAGLERTKRYDNLQDAFVARDVRARRVCLIDDVCTTGSTLVHCAAALAAAGAAEVRAITWTGQPNPLDPTA